MPDRFRAVEYQKQWYVVDSTPPTVSVTDAAKFDAVTLEAIKSGVRSNHGPGEAAKLAAEATAKSMTADAANQSKPPAPLSLTTLAQTLRGLLG